MRGCCSTTGQTNASRDAYWWINMEPGQEGEKQVEKSDDLSRLSQEAEDMVVKVLYTPPSSRSRRVQDR